MSLYKCTPKTSKLVFLRHGQSQWNLENRFTGWHDVELSELGVKEAIQAGKLLKQTGINFDSTYTSVLKRAIITHFYVLTELNLLYLPVTRSWRLNERHYGGLTGLNKEETAKKHGEKQVKLWRRSYDIPPPDMDFDSEYSSFKDPKYHNVPKAIIPKTESLKDTLNRTLPFLYDQILPDIMEGKNVLVVAHGNSIRSIMKELDKISDQDIVDLNLDTGIPYVYEMDRCLNIIKKTTIKNESDIAKLSN